MTGLDKRVRSSAYTENKPGLSIKTCDHALWHWGPLPPASPLKKVEKLDKYRSSDVTVAQVEL